MRPAMGHPPWAAPPLSGPPHGRRTVSCGLPLRSHARHAPGSRQRKGTGPAPWPVPPLSPAVRRQAFGPLAAASAASLASHSAITSIGGGAFARKTQVKYTASTIGGSFSAISTQPSCVASPHQ